MGTHEGEKAIKKLQKKWFNTGEKERCVVDKYNCDDICTKYDRSCRKEYLQQLKQEAHSKSRGMECNNCR